MAEPKRIKKDRKEEREEDSSPKKKAQQPLYDQLKVPDEGNLPATELVFGRSIENHAALLAGARSNGQRANLVAQLQRAYGNAYVQRLLKSRMLQAKLTVSSPDDKYEREADRVAEAVTQTPTPEVQRQEEEEEEIQPKVVSEVQRQEEPEEEEEEVQAKAISEVQRQEEEEEEIQPKAVSEIQKQEEPEEEEEVQAKPALEVLRQEEEEEVQAKLSLEVQRQEEEPEEEEEIQAKPALEVLRQEEEEEVQAKPSLEVQRQEEELEEEEEIQAKPASDIQRQEEEEEEIQPKAVSEIQTEYSAVSEDLEGQINTARGNGQPLSDSVRASLEPRFGYDFGQVNIHTDAEASRLSQQLGARAFTAGSDIFFGSGEYNPQNSSGQQLIAHELTHVVQQGGASSLQTVQRVDVKNRVRPPVPKNKPWKRETKATEGKKTEERETEEKKVEEPYKYDALAGMDRTIYDRAKEKFNQMKKPRILGGLSKTRRKLEAVRYLKDTVEASKKYTPHTQMVVNSIMEAYRETFSEELKEERAPERLEEKGQEKVSKWEKFKAFVSSVFDLKSWIGWVKDFIAFCKDPKAAVQNSPITLPAFLSFAQPIANTVTSFMKWLPIVDIVKGIWAIISGGVKTWSKLKDMLSLRSAAKSAKEKEGAEAEQLAEAAAYGYAKVRRGFLSRLFSLVKAVADTVLGVAKLVVGMFTGGIAAIVIQAISMASTLVDMARTAFRKIKGFGKWILGKRGKARRENAEKIVMAARGGSEEAMVLILKLDPSGIARGDKLDKFWYWLKYWGAEKKEHNKEMLKGILQDWDKAEVDTLVKGVAEKLKSQ